MKVNNLKKILQRRWVFYLSKKDCTKLPVKNERMEQNTGEEEDG